MISKLYTLVMIKIKGQKQVEIMLRLLVSGLYAPNK